MDNVLAKHGDDLKPGDIIIANDPYCGISHMPDITLIAPAFWHDELAGFLISYSHHTMWAAGLPRHLQPVPVEL